MLWRVLPQLYFITQTKVSPEQRSSGRRAGVPFGVCLDERWLSEIEVCHPSLGSELSMVLTLGIQAVLRSVARNLPCHGTRRRPPPAPRTPQQQSPGRDPWGDAGGPVPC